VVLVAFDRRAAQLAVAQRAHDRRLQLAAVPRSDCRFEMASRWLCFRRDSVCTMGASASSAGGEKPKSGSARSRRVWDDGDAESEGPSCEQGAAVSCGWYGGSAPERRSRQRRSNRWSRRTRNTKRFYPESKPGRRAGGWVGRGWMAGGLLGLELQYDRDARRRAGEFALYDALGHPILTAR